MRQCSKCDLWKSLDEYYWENKRRRYAYSCKKCTIKQTMEWQKNNYKHYRKLARKAHRDWVKRQKNEFLRLREENKLLKKLIYEKEN